MKQEIQRDWWLKSLSGTVLGASLALGLVGLWAWWGPGGLGAPDKVQFNMWMIAPLWMLALSAVYFMRSGAQALLALLALNALAYGLLLWAQSGAVA
ncbi:hypothetical protein ACS5PK_12670 [Roseateles sp. DB2]|uniref:hypothetical protein n=1 Tax=Roseateles sp. DB2 TaxID=3453717 RepID=UPI003EE917D5